MITKVDPYLAAYVLVLWPTHRCLEVTELVEAFHNKDVFVENDPAVLDQDLESGNVCTVLHRGKLLTKNMARF